MINTFDPIGMAMNTKIRELEETNSKLEQRVQKLERLVENLTKTMSENFTECAKRMAAQEIATGTRRELIAEHKDLLDEYGICPQVIVGSKSDVLVNKLIEIGKKRTGDCEKVYFTTGDVMRIFNIPDKHYATARRIMENSAKDYPGKVNVVKKCKIGRNSATVIELIK